MGDLTWFDGIVLGVVLISALLGAWRGVVSEVLALCAWVAAFLAARAWGGAAATAAAPMLHGLANDALRQAAGFLLVFITTLVIFALLRLLLTSLLRAIGLGLTDRLLGTVFGLARGLLVVWTGVLLAGLTSLPRQAWWHEAWLSPPLETAVIASKPWLPASLAQKIHFRAAPAAHLQPNPYPYLYGQAVTQCAESLV
jgi:membrane protein required for colicin V production